jgi:hypothetical protein
MHGRLNFSYFDTLTPDLHEGGCICVICSDIGVNNLFYKGVKRMTSICNLRFSPYEFLVQKSSLHFILLERLVKGEVYPSQTNRKK